MIRARVLFALRPLSASSCRRESLARKLLFAAALLPGLLAASAAPCLAQRVVVVVRHADKVDDSDDAALSARGEEQAERLAHVLKDVRISAVYVTQFQRTKRTAAPLMKALGIEPVTYEQKDVDGVVAQIRREHADDAVMVVGHRSTVPMVLAKLGCTEKVALESSETDSIFVLTFTPGAGPRLLHLRY